MFSAPELVSFARTDLGLRIDQLLESRELLADVAGRSYVHDNGFVKIVLVRGDETGGALRLHMWRGDSTDAGNIHNHCWDFTSLVLAGKLDFEEFSIDAQGDVSAHRFAYDPLGEFDYELRSFGMTRLRLGATGARRSGEVYEMPADRLHRAWGGVPATVTLLSQGSRRRDHADVYVTRATGVPAVVSNAALGLSELRRCLVEVRELLAREPL